MKYFDILVGDDLHYATYHIRAKTEVEAIKKTANLCPVSWDLIKVKEIKRFPFDEPELFCVGGYYDL
jgi:hypothetical protein